MVASKWTGLISVAVFDSLAQLVDEEGELVLLTKSFGSMTVEASPSRKNHLQTFRSESTTLSACHHSSTEQFTFEALVILASCDNWW